MQTPATLLLRNARIFTMSPAQPWAEALAAVGDRVAWVGRDDDAGRWVGPRTQVIDGGGRLALPGLIDSHFHLLLGARAMGQLDLEDATSLGEVQSRLADYAADSPRRDWIIGRGWKYSLFPPGMAIHRETLDAAVSDRPVLLTAFDGHTAWANTVALERAGILGGAETGSAFSQVVMGAGGMASGELREGAAMDLVRRLVPPMGTAEQEDLLRAALRRLAALGVTGVHNMDGDESQLAMYERFAAAGELSLRVLLPFSVRPGTPPERIDAWADLARHHNRPLLRASAAKLFMDGVVESKTALLLTPYADGSGDLGVANYEQEEFEELVVRADARGLQVFVHAIGDGAVRRTLDGFAAARRHNGARDARHRVEHVELIDPSDVGRFADLGVIAAMQPLHANFGLDAQNTWRRLAGPERWPWGFAWRSLRDAGVRIAFGSDWPVASPDPLRGLHVARNRIKLDFSGPASAFPDQRVSLEEALAAYTFEAAYAGHREAELGRLAPGYLADLVLISQNLFAIPSAEIGATHVELTVVGGDVVYAV
jgi:predicted amidohydrolase YtcJ